MRTLRLALLSTAVVGAVVGAVVFFLPPSLGPDTAPPLLTGTPLAPPAMAAGNPTFAEDLVLANAFSVRRAPPATRYVPPDASIDSSGGVVADTTTMAGLAPADAGAPLLLGTVVGEHGTQALLQLDPIAGAPRLYAEGDRDGGYRVMSIVPGRVVLAGPRGRITLRLEPEEKRP